MMEVIRTVRDRTQTSRAQALRRGATYAEKRLWESLRARRLNGWKWRGQTPKGPYIVDFVCEELRLIVELDGSQHAEQEAYDERRTAYLEILGYRVMRFWNSQVLEATDGVCGVIAESCANRANELKIVSPPEARSAEERGEVRRGAGWK